MSIATNAVLKVERKLPKIIDARQHGVIDYCHAAFFLGMALVCRKRQPRAALAALITGSFVLAESLLTDYPLGAFKVMPFRIHGELDAGFASMSFLVPRIFGFSGTKEATIFTTNGFVEGAVVGATDFSSAHARSEERQLEAAD